jgi:hypothetical protein
LTREIETRIIPETPGCLNPENMADLFALEALVFDPGSHLLDQNLSVLVRAAFRA